MDRESLILQPGKGDADVTNGVPASDPFTKLLDLVGVALSADRAEPTIPSNIDEPEQHQTS
ncbi:hypothetical protein MLP_04260 [Microlunatus phosphovorus NM-1]|uniref:Uncharacterized protein n=1 Tax=Microlunatus phosphovorus (strain ATCC 700054 / DSM 10555 / JCM 9379 / NBRC 101784 / NCIMB 13414 / VKM Ac-1990 / NM-1) TaxID=1032480 RepID=F5XJB4_MICPN|nr:hypothetical protein MLP_04260 [Microlunatus phosphovorus NM-1]